MERNLLFAGFYSVEGFECLDHTGEIECSNQEFELIAVIIQFTVQLIIMLMNVHTKTKVAKMGGLKDV